MALAGRCLVTGGAGFIGSNLIRALLSRPGLKIRVLDNLSSGRGQDLDNLPVEMVVGDIRDRDLVDRVMAGIQVVIALAAHTGVVQSVENPAEDLSINVAGTLNLLEAAVRHRVDRFIFASTGGAIVGEAVPPVHEDLPPRPLSPYGAGKLAGEGYCSAFWGSYGLKTVPLRFSNIYGPFSYHKGSVIAKFFRLVQARRELTIFGDGEQTRDFLFVDDLCRAIRTAMTADLPFGEPVQLGTGRETSINALVHLMRQVVGESRFPPVRYAPPRPGEVQRNFMNIARARKFLHFNPATDLATGLRKTWQWFQKVGSP
uniref:NAD-dependent epimerase/dehydratase family protein n=1 Tax=Desulfobacca acetoxidans TaxID=60893 RepID=A0A7C3V986_9BACT